MHSGTAHTGKDAVSATGNPASPGLLLVDDDSLIVDSLTLVLRRDYDVHAASGCAQARARMQQLEQSPPLALVDLGLPPTPHEPEQGFQLIRDLLALNPRMKILVLSGQSERRNIQHALTLGAVDFIPKPCDIELLKSRLAHQCMILEAEQQADQKIPAGDSLLLGESSSILELRNLIGQFSLSPFPVLIEGESGTGKELVARQLHVDSPRADRPFMTINCAAFTPELLEAQLFGHARGAFTGAADSRSGFFEAAGTGSLLLDEVGELPLDLQSKLLRVLDNGEYYRLGETRPRKAQARILAATNRDLRAAVQAGQFRQDLFHRLSVLSIRVPPLRDRDHDSLLLLQHFCQLYSQDLAPFRLQPEAEACLLAYPFPGNVRELRNIVIRLLAKYSGQPVNRAQVEAELEDQVSTTAQDAPDRGDRVEEDLLQNGFELDTRLQDWERRYIDAALKISDSNLSRAARMLGINRTTLYSRIQRLTRDKS